LLSSILLSVALIECCLRIFPNLLYLTPEDKILAYNYKWQSYFYKANTKINLTIPYGDLLRFFNNRPTTVAQPRELYFQTDSLGFRNNADYNGEKVILIGDSFIVGVASSQQDILSNQLSNNYGIRCYNIAFPADIVWDTKALLSFTKNKSNIHDDVNIILFLFEGCRFEVQNSVEVSKKSYLWGIIRDYLKPFLFYKLGWVSWHKYFVHTSNQKVLILQLEAPNNEKMAFYKDYIDVTNRDKLILDKNFVNNFQIICQNVKHIFFIPTKYRVYYELIKGHDHSLPNAQWEALVQLASLYNVKCHNLTEPLQQKAKELFLQRKYVYWKDDTHWSPDGIAVAAEKINEILKNNNSFLSHFKTQQ
jgi:hypothetical protein